MTAVEWMEEMLSMHGLNLSNPAFQNVINQAKEMEKVEKIKAQIEVLKMTHLRLSVEGIHNADNTMVFTITELEQQLKQLEDGSI